MYLSDSDNNSLETGEGLAARAGSNRKVLRKCAAVAASKIKLMSDIEEGSSSENACSGRRLPHRIASAVARKKLLYNSEDEDARSPESEPEEEEEELREQDQPAAAPPKAASGSENADSESERALQEVRRSWHANGYRSQAAAASRTSLLATESSEDSAGSGSGPPRTIGPPTSRRQLKAGSVSGGEEEADSEPRKHPGRKFSTARKSTAFLKKAKVFTDSEDSDSEEERGGGRHRKTEADRLPGSLKGEPPAAARCSSAPVSETDVDSDEDRAKGTPNHFPRGNGQQVSHSSYCPFLPAYLALL